MSKEFNHLVAILHVYAEDLNFMKWKKNIIIFQKENGDTFTLLTQVGSPAACLRLARCTAWVKQWSEAMDFLQTIFKTNTVAAHLRAAALRESQDFFSKGHST